MNKYVTFILLISQIYFFGPNKIISQITPIILKDNWEVWYDKIPVSGNLMVGIMNQHSNDLIGKPIQFNCTLPKKHKMYLHAEISSISGRYEANLIYDISNLNGGEYEFYVPTKYSDKLKLHENKNVSLLLRGCDNKKILDDTNCEYYFGKWYSSKKTDTLFVLLNTENPSFISYLDLNGKSTEIKCRKLYELNAVAYNCLCKVSIQDIKNSTNIKILHRSRKGGIVKLVPHSLNIKI